MQLNHRTNTCHLIKLSSLCGDMNKNGVLSIGKSLRKELPVFQLRQNYFNVFGAVLEKND